ncbi:cytochrome P450 [Mycena crocata]|nr:cytochrome P450 [Mycena crocata]
MPSLDLKSGTLCATIVFSLLAYRYHSRQSRSKLPLPPGPRKLPLVGNLFDVPATFQWKAYKKWSAQYDSDIIYLDLAGTPLIVLSSVEATDALLDKRAAIYSDRMHLPMVMDLMGWDFNFSLMKYGDEWRTHRRLFNEAFTVKASQKYEPQEEAVTRTLLKRLLQTPDDFIDHFRQNAGELIMSVAYGIDILPTEDPYITLARKAVHTFTLANVPGRYLVNTFPILKHVPSWFPGAGFKRQAAEWKKLSRGMLELPFAETKRQMESDVARPSFVSESLSVLSESKNNAYYTEQQVKTTAGTMFFGGADTTVSAMTTFVLSMLANPEAQKRAQAEIDAVTGGGCLPTFEHRDAMPYVAALVKEVHRWENVAPFALPRLLNVEDEYRGYRIPAGSIVMGNTWGILHDETTYPEPFAFKPERFLLDGQLNPAVRDPLATFGYGRRLCPGRHMVDSSLWITIVNILAAFDIRKAVDEAGNVIEPSYEYLSGSISAPLPFKCAITPRSEMAAALVRGKVDEDAGLL